MYVIFLNMLVNLNIIQFDEMSLMNKQITNTRYGTETESFVFIKLVYFSKMHHEFLQWIASFTVYMSTNNPLPVWGNVEKIESLYRQLYQCQKYPDSELWLLNVNVLLNTLQIIQKPFTTDTEEKERGEIYNFMVACWTS